MAPPTFLGYSGPPIHVASCRDHRHTIGQNPVQSHSQSLGGYPPPIHRWRCSMQGFIKTLISGNRRPLRKNIDARRLYTIAKGF